jgi:hypothetical protein
VPTAGLACRREPVFFFFLRNLLFVLVFQTAFRFLKRLDAHAPQHTQPKDGWMDRYVGNFNFNVNFNVNEKPIRVFVAETYLPLPVLPTPIRRTMSVASTKE